MKRDPCINAVLNDRQLDFFCSRFELLPAEIEVCTDGWFKNVLLARDRAYLFPRDPSIAKLTELFMSIAQLKPVLVHADVHEDQLLVASSSSSEISAFSIGKPHGLTIRSGILTSVSGA